MFKRKLYKISLIALLSSAGLHASALASTEPVDLAKQEEILSQKVITAYAQHRDISQVIHHLKERQIRLKGAVHDPEILNLLNFLELCLNRIQTISKKPHFDGSKEIVADLGTSISEGSRYIARSLQ